MWFLIPLLGVGSYFAFSKPAEAKTTATKTGNALKDSFNTVLNAMKSTITMHDVPGGNSTEIILARTIFGEARNEGTAGMSAVASVIVNRAKAARTMWGGGTIKGVCLRRAQFSCWNPYYGLSTKNAGIMQNYKRMISVTSADALFVDALAIAKLAISGKLVDTTKGSTYYHTTSIKPDWAQGVLPTKIVGAHAFYTTKQIG